MFYSKSTGGFYSSDIYGPRTITIVAPGWQHPQIEIPDPFSPDSATILVDDPAVVAPTIEIANPACLIPSDAVEITEAEHQLLLSGQSSGKRIVANAEGFPELQDPPPPSAEQVRAASVASIETRRDEALLAGVVVDGLRHHTDNVFLTELLGLLMGYQVGVMSGVQDIRTMDNTIVQLGAQEIATVAAAVGAHRKAVYAQSWAEKDAL